MYFFYREELIIRHLYQNSILYTSYYIPRNTKSERMHLPNGIEECFTTVRLLFYQCLTLGE